MTKPADSDQIAKARRDRAKKFAGVNYETLAGEYPSIIDAMAAFAASERQAVIEECANIAGGMTGPGNTPEQCQGYSDACRDIQRAIRSME